MSRTGNGTQVRPGDDAVCTDTETTGLDTSKDRIIEMGMVVVRAGRLAESWSGRIHPGEDALARMSEEAEQVHQISAGALAGEPDFETRWHEAQAWIAEHADGLPVVAHNAEFDRAFITAELERIAEQAHPWGDAARWVDTWQRSREEFGDSGGSHGLDGLAKRLKVARRAAGAAHDALGDAELLAKCWCRWGIPAMGDLFDEDHAGEGDHADTALAPIIAWPDAARESEAWNAFWANTLGERTA